VANALKRTGHYDMSLRAHELALWQELQSFLQLFSAMTDLVSSKIIALSFVDTSCSRRNLRCALVLCKGQWWTEIAEDTNPSRQYWQSTPLTDCVILTTLLDPSTKSLVNMTESEKEELYTAVTECRERADQQTSVDNTSQLSVILCSHQSLTDSRLLWGHL